MILKKNGLMFLYIRKLIEDKLIKSEKILLDDEFLPNEFSVTFKGRLFINNGGYKNQLRKESISVNLQLIATWAIVIGTSLAGVYSLYSLLKDILLHFDIVYRIYLFLFH